MAKHQVPLKFYKSFTNGKASYQVLPSAGVGPGLTEVKDLSEIQSEIGRFTGKTDAWSQRYLSTLQEGLKKVQSGISPFALDPKGVLTTQKALASQEVERKALAEGTMVNIGTEEAPLLVPKGSPAHQLATAPPKLKPIVQEMQIAAGQIPGIQAGIKELRAPEAPEPPGITAEDLGISVAEDTGVVDSSAARRERIEKDIEDRFGEAEIPGKPALPMAEADFEALRSEKGMEALETRMTSITDEIRQLEDATRADLRTEEGELKPMSLINIASQEIIKDRQEQIDALLRSKAVLVDEYNVKANIINQTMAFKQMDYNAAVADYNTSFNQAIQLQNLIEGRISKEAQIENQQIDNARANLSVITKMMSDQGKIWEDLDASFQNTITKLEMQADLPVGVTRAFYDEYPDDEVVYETKGTDAEGREFVSFISKDKDGNYSVKNVYTGGLGIEEVRVKLSSDDIGRLSAVGLSTTEITDIQSYLNKGGIIDGITGLTDEQTRTLSQILKGVTPTQAATAEEEEKEAAKTFFSKDWFKETYSESTLKAMTKEWFVSLYWDENAGEYSDELSKIAREAGFARFWTGKQGEIEKYLKSNKALEYYLTEIMKGIEARREVGISDTDIFKDMQ